MLRIWLYAIFTGSLFAAASQNLTVDDLDASIVLFPLGDWAWSNQGFGVNNNTFSFSNSVAAIVRFTFPVPATAVYWRGFKRSGAALYSICIDCTGPDDPNYELVDGHDKNALPDTPTTLFSKEGLSHAIHNVTIKNLLDSRFNNPSQMTLDGFILTTSDNEPNTTPTAPASTSMPIGPSDTVLSSGSPTAVSNRASVHSKNNIPIIVGALVAGGSLILIVIAAGIFWWWKRRHATYSTLDDQRNKDIGEYSPMMNTLNTMPVGAQARGIMTGSPELRYTDTTDGLYQRFPTPPDHFPSRTFNNVASKTRPWSPDNLYKHSATESSSSTGSLLLTTNTQRSLSSTQPGYHHIPILLSNPFTNPSYEAADAHPTTALDGPSDVGRWYPSLIAEYSTDPRPTKRPVDLRKPMPAFNSNRKDARPASSVSSVFPSATLRVSAIVDAMHEVMTTPTKNERPRPVHEASTARRPGPSPHQLSPPYTAGHSRSPSSSPVFI